MKLRQALLAGVLGLWLQGPAWAQISVSISIAPPPLLVYAQPPVPGEGYIWMPGYWSWSDADRGYYWVPGTWVLAPNEGDLWTPGYWAFENAVYFWHIGYWGSRVGFYGGINYGHGYSGSGYQGGRWDHGAFRYNRAVSNVDAHRIHDAYSAPVVPGRSPSRVSFNGGRAGAKARPSAGERRFQSAEHAGPRADQQAHETTARGLPTQRGTGPHKVPQVAATPRPSEFSAPDAEPVRAAPVARPVRSRTDPGEAMSARRPATDPPHRERPVAPPMRSEEPRGMRDQQPRSEPRGRADRPDAPQQEGPSRRER